MDRQIIKKFFFLFFFDLFTVFSDSCCLTIILKQSRHWIFRRLYKVVLASIICSFCQSFSRLLRLLPKLQISWTILARLQILYLIDIVNWISDTTIRISIIAKNWTSKTWILVFRKCCLQDCKIIRTCSLTFIQFNSASIFFFFL